VRRTTVSYSSVDLTFDIATSLKSLWEIDFFPRPDVGRRPSDIGGTVGPTLRHLSFLFKWPPTDTHGRTDSVRISGRSCGCCNRILRSSCYKRLTALHASL